MKISSSKFEYSEVNLEEDLEDILNMSLTVQDKLTLFGMYGDCKYEGRIIHTVGSSLWALKVTLKGGDPHRIYALYGLSPHYRNVGVPWVLCSEEASKYPLEFGRNTKKMVEKMHTSRPILVNWCPPESFRFVKWLGFEVTHLTHTSVYNPSIVYHFVLKRKKEK